MSTEPDKIYLHDPHGVFDEDGHSGLETVTWSEDQIDENDYEYVMNPQKLSKSDAYSLLAEVRAELEDEYFGFIEVKEPIRAEGLKRAIFLIDLKMKKISEHFS